MTIFWLRPRCWNPRPSPLPSASPINSGARKERTASRRSTFFPTTTVIGIIWCPPVDGSATLADYIGKELHAAWQAGLETDPVRALHALAITFAAPELVPRAPLQGLSADAAAAAIEAVSKVEDPFSLVGAFEICADRARSGSTICRLGRAPSRQSVRRHAALDRSVRALWRHFCHSHGTLRHARNAPAPAGFLAAPRRCSACFFSCPRMRRKRHRSEPDYILGDASFWRRILSFGRVRFRGRAAMAARMDSPEDSRRGSVRPHGRSLAPAFARSRSAKLEGAR